MDEVESLVQRLLKYLEKDDFVEFYDSAFEICESRANESMIGQVTRYFVDNDVNPLDYTNGEVPTGCFYGCTELDFEEPIKIDWNSITVVNDYAFYESQGIIGKADLSKVKGIYTGAFQSSDIAGDIELNCKVINAYAFANCTNLTSVTLTNNVSTINKCAFQNLRYAEIYLNNDIYFIASDAFAGCQHVTIYCSHKVYDTFKKAFSSKIDIKFTD